MSPSSFHLLRRKRPIADRSPSGRALVSRRSSSSVEMVRCRRCCLLGLVRPRRCSLSTCRRGWTQNRAKGVGCRLRRRRRTLSRFRCRGGSESRRKTIHRTGSRPLLDDCCRSLHHHCTRLPSHYYPHFHLPSPSTTSGCLLGRTHPRYSRVPCPGDTPRRRPRRRCCRSISVRNSAERANSLDVGSASHLLPRSWTSGREKVGSPG